MSAPVSSRCPALYVALVLALVSVLAQPAGPAEAKGSLFRTDTTWLEGAEGFAQAFDEANPEGQAVLLYFYADWCGYCRQLESKLFEQPAVRNYTQTLVKIRINPEQGARERELAERYGVRGYPAVFVHAPGSPRPRRVGRMIVEGGRRRLATPAEYVEMLSRAGG